MTLVIAFAAFCIVVFGVTAGPALYKNNINAKKLKERAEFLLEMRRFGTEDQKMRAEQIGLRDSDLHLKLLECEQAAMVLDVPGIREKLEGSNVDVEELKKLLSDSENDEVLNEYKRLIQNTTEEKE